MASNFAQYTNGVVMPTGISEAGANIGKMTQQGLASFGQSLGEGLQAYNENVAKDQVLQEEAKQLGTQIQQFAAQFGDSPEHAPFAQSLQPYIEQLSKVPSMSLTQKMGTVTGVKAAFGNIGQQLQAFETMRSERLKRDYWKARNETPSTNVVTDPVAIAKGEVPWDDTKTYDQNVAGFRAVAQKAIDNGVAIDIEKASGLYVANIKQALKTGRDKQGRPIAPETLAALQDQIAKGETFEQDLLNSYLGEDEASSFNSLMNLGDTVKSARDKVNEQRAAKAKAEGKPAPEPETIEAWKAKKKSAEDAIGALQGRAYNKTEYDKAVADYDALVKKDKETFDKATTDWQARTKDAVLEYESIPDRIDKLRSMQSRIPEEIPDDSPRGQKFGRSKINPEYIKVDKQIKELQERRDELSHIYYNQEGNKPKLQTRTAPTIDQFKAAGDTTPNAPQNLEFYAKQVKEADKNINKLERIETAKKESVNLEKQIKDLEAKVADGETLAPSEVKRYQDNLQSAFFKYWEGVQNIAIPTAIRRMGNEPITQESADRIVAELKDGMGGHFKLGSLVNLSIASNHPLAQIWTKLGVIPEGRQLTQNEARYIENALKDTTNKNDTSRALKYGTDAEKLEALKKLKTEFDSEITSGVRNPTPAEKSKMQGAKKAEAEKPTLIGTSNNLVIGTRRREVKASVEQQEAAMAGFFQKKYGYVPAGFSEMYRANTPEANFKTMETPYGAFMWDGKGWNQIKTSTPMSAKEAGENAAYQFSNPDGSPKEFANSGVYLSGTFQGTTTELAKFRTEYRSLAHAEKSIARLIEINEMTGESLSPTLKGEAKALLPAIKAALRTEIIGVGTVSNYEQELINDVVAGAADFWSLESSDRAKLAVIMDRVRNSINDVPAIYGLSVQRKGDSANIEKSLRQALLTSGGISSREAKWRAANPDKQ